MRGREFDVEFAAQVLWQLRGGHTEVVTRRLRGYLNAGEMPIEEALLGHAARAYLRGDFDNAELYLRQCAEPKFHSIGECKSEYDYAMGRAQA